MEPARKHVVQQSAVDRRTESETEKARRLEWETKAGKIIFYLTVAVAVWFFYWLNGTPCPC